MIHVLIMAGGSGTRFWPLSRSEKPKQFLKILGKKNLLLMTLDRIKNLASPNCIWIVSTQNQHKNLPKSFPDSHVIIEPLIRNTAACIGLSAFELFKKDPNALMCICPSDHIIQDQKAFDKTLSLAISEVENHNTMVMIGIKPTYPHSGFGYIEVASTETADTAITIESFKEKPDTKTAKAYIQSKRYFWNAGIFVWRADRFIEALRVHLPKTYHTLRSYVDLPHSDKKNRKALFESLEKISVDHGILEHVGKELKVIPASFDWDDLGSWSSLEKYLPKDKDKNTTNVPLYTVGSKKNIVFSSHKKAVALININDLIIVDSDDILLILPKKNDQEVRLIQDILPKNLK